MKLFETIVNAITDYDVNIDVNDNELSIVNRNNGNDLLVRMDEYFSSEDETESFIRCTVYFSTQHWDIDVKDSNEEKVTGWIVAYIISILKDEVLPIEFYRDGQGGRGGEIYLEDLNKLSVSFLAEQFYYTSDYLLDYLLSLDYEIHSWSGKYDTGLRKVSDLKP